MIIEDIYGYKHRIKNQEIIKLPYAFMFAEFEWARVNGDELIINKYYSWDGSSCVPDTKATKKASLVHDVLCQMIKLGYIPKSERKKADKCYRDLIIEFSNGKEKALAAVYYRGLRMFGWAYSKKAKEPKVYEI